jgi:hypothetical protein
MEKPRQPTKEQVRSYIENRQAEHKMPPSMEEIRRQLGWLLYDGTESNGSLKAQ